ncbi:MAG: hypothetical protein WD824_18370 [Cyclobacteriaceae bacterium]
MTKGEKKQIILSLLKEFIQSDKPGENEHLIDKIVLEIQSCGFESVQRLSVVNNAIGVFLTDIITKTFNKDTKNWETVSSVVALLQLVEISTLSD